MPNLYLKCIPRGTSLNCCSHSQLANYLSMVLSSIILAKANRAKGRVYTILQLKNKKYILKKVDSNI